jgi:hypothetical protein
VDASLTRSGRFDIKVAIPLPDAAGRAEIIAKMIRELIARHERPGFRMFAEDVDPRELAALTPGLTGADIREVLRRVQLAKAMAEATGGRPARTTCATGSPGCAAADLQPRTTRGDLCRPPCCPAVISTSCSTSGSTCRG